MPQPLTITVKPYVPPRKALELAWDQAVRAAARHVGDADHRVLSLRLAPPERKTRRPAKATDFHATVYDYTNARTLDLRGSLKESAKVEIVESGRQPGVSHEEWEAAVEVLRRGGDFGVALRDGTLKPYKPMPVVASAGSRSDCSRRGGAGPTRSSGSSSRGSGSPATTVARRRRRSRPRRHAACRRMPARRRRPKGLRARQS